MVELGGVTRRSASHTDALVARQPIYEPSQRTFGYELLFRNSRTNAASILNPEEATAQVIVNSFLEIGLDRMVGSAPAFINVTDKFILSGYCESLPKDRIIFEILEDTVPGPELLAELATLRNLGYRFALDDYTFQPHLRPLIPFCHFLKVDLRDVDRSKLRGLIADSRAAGRIVLAEKVETFEEFEFCREAGFHLFQGYFFCRPRIVSAATIPMNRIAICRLLAKLHQPDISTQEVESIVGEDLSLSYRLLRYINSASIALSKTVQSINHAVRLVGTEQIKLLASLIMLTSLDEKPRELMTTSLVRAKMCELLASVTGVHATEPFFTVGLFSALDAFLDCSMTQALELLPLAADIREALLTRGGDPGKVLESVLSYEQAHWDDTKLAGITPVGAREVYLRSLQWADKLIRSFNQPDPVTADPVSC